MLGICDLGLFRSQVSKQKLRITMETYKRMKAASLFLRSRDYETHLFKTVARETNGGWSGDAVQGFRREVQTQTKNAPRGAKLTSHNRDVSLRESSRAVHDIGVFSGAYRGILF